MHRWHAARGRRWTRSAAAVLAAALLAAGAVSCSSSGSAKPGRGDAGPPPLTAPALTGRGSLGPATGDDRPKYLPVGAAAALQGHPLPTNTWWTSALVGDFTSTLWAFPIAARAGSDGLALSAPTPSGAPNAVISGFAPAVTVGGPLQRAVVTGYGDFSVDLRLDRTGAPLQTVVAQGSPFVPVQAPAGDLPIGLTGAGDVTASDGRPLAVGTTLRADAVRFTALGQVWYAAASEPVDWRRTDAGLVAASPQAVTYALSPLPGGTGEDWAAATVDAARHPVTGTRSTLSRSGGTVTQQLSWQGTSASGVVAVLAHQRATLPRTIGTAAGRYPTPRGDLSLVRGNTLTLTYPLPGFLPSAPQIPLSQQQKDQLAGDLASDLATADSSGGGSYYGPKALGRLATLLDVAHRIGEADAQAQILRRLEPLLADWFTYSGPGDRHWLAYDSAWGGITGHPSEFENNNYNDHHFQFGYLIAAAAEVAQVDRQFARDYGSVVDALVTDVIGAGNGPTPSAAAAFPPYRVFSAYEGHSLASGFATVPDGADQESSSEAVHAWAAIAEWGMATGRSSLTDAGLERYAVEAESARTYWLGEGERLWPAEYEHDTAGIVWGGKVDYATFFDGRPEAVIGIQLLPFSFDSLYRTDGSAARRRDADASSTGGGTPRLWPDLFLMDSALTDPAAAVQRFTGATPIEAGNSRTFTQYWLWTLGALGTPDPTVTADVPYGYAFRSGAGRRLAAVNPTDRPLTVTWRDAAGAVIGRAEVAPGAASTVGG